MASKYEILQGVNDALKIGEHPSLLVEELVPLAGALTGASDERVLVVIREMAKSGAIKIRALKNDADEPDCLIVPASYTGDPQRGEWPNGGLAALLQTLEARAALA